MAYERVKPTIYLLLCIQHETDDGQKTCPKYLEFYSKNKFEKFVHLVSVRFFLLRILRVALRYRRKGQRNIGRPKKRWRGQLHLTIKEQETRLTLQEHDDDDNVDECISLVLLSE